MNSFLRVVLISHISFCYGWDFVIEDKSTREIFNLHMHDNGQRLWTSPPPIDENNRLYLEHVAAQFIIYAYSYSFIGNTYDLLAGTGIGRALFKGRGYPVQVELGESSYQIKSE